MKQKVIDSIYAVVKNLGFETQVELTPAKGHGDFSTNVAMKLASIAKENPRVLADKIASGIKEDFIAKVEVAGPGFINIFLSSDINASIVQEIIDEADDYGKGKQNKYINVEYVSANPTGHLHLGHARGAAVGSTLVNILRFAGNKVDSEYYVNDAGNQIDILGISVFERYRELFGKELNLPEDSYRGQDIVEVANYLKEKYGDKFLNSSYEEVKDTFKSESKAYLLEVIKKHLKNYNVVIDIYSSEEKIHQSDAIENAMKKISKYTYEQDGATWLDTTSKGDDKDRVLIKKDGKYTYLTPDIAYHNEKLSRGYDELINIWGADHIGYIKRMQVALEYLGLPSEKLDIFTIQLVKLMKEGQELKMSKRKGTSYTIEELIEEIGIDAARWYMLDRSVNSSVAFDVEEAKKQSSDNPVFTVQYTHARANQLIGKSDVKPEPGNYNEKEVELINTLSKFPHLIEKIADSHKTHMLPQYLLEVSREFNSWYANSKVIGDEREASMIALACATKIVLNNGLKMLGINAPKKM